MRMKLNFLKRKLKALYRNVLDLSLQPYFRELREERRLAEKVSPATKAALIELFGKYQRLPKAELPGLEKTGLRVFSQFEEDGKLLYIFALLDIFRGSFLDLGSGDGINSNCANLALNFGWSGVFVDGSEQNVERGRRFYESHPDAWAYPPRFVEAMITAENINEIAGRARVPIDVDLLSIDIDGNDYWVWKALDVVRPKVVIIETHVEFGFKSIVVPYDKDYVYPGRHPDYHGASPVAMAKMAKEKGYRLVGSNDYGFNTIYVKNGLAEDVLPEVTVESIMDHPRNVERMKRFEAIADWDYLTV